MKFKVGDQVQIRMDKVNKEYKKYIDIYTIKEIKKNFKGIYLYKLKGVPNWGTEDIIFACKYR